MIDLAHIFRKLRIFLGIEPASLSGAGRKGARRAALRIEALERRDVPSALLSEAKSLLFSSTATAKMYSDVVPLVPQARAESVLLNNQLRQFRTNVDSQPQHTLGQTLILQTVALLGNERDSWESTWRQIGVAHAPFAPVQAKLVALQNAYIAANAQLLNLQKLEIQHGMAGPYMAPHF
jgi:hypothetical protein